MHLPDEPEPSPQINVVPMIDILFVVLIFFILSSLLLVRTEGLPVNLPDAETSERQLEQHTLRLSLTADGILQLGNDVTTIERLPAQVQARRIGNAPLMVIIQADKTVDHGNVVQVMDSLRTLEGIQLAIATNPIPTGAQP